MPAEIDDCRLCRTPLTEPPVLEVGPFPHAAQHFPVKAEASQELGIQLQVYQCPGCGLVQLRSPAVDYYREVITAASLSPWAKAARLGEIAEFVERYQLRGRRALEIGCGKGHMLEVLTEAGLSAQGLEFGENSVAEGREHGRDIVQGYVDDVDLELPAEVFFAFNFLEHQPDVKGFLHHLGRLTSSDAMGYLTVPNLEFLLQSKCLYEFVADHLVYFTESSLRRAMETHGFEVLSSELINNDNDILVIVKKRPQLALGPDLAELQGLAAKLNALVAGERECGRKVAVWGAGHRTLALLSFSQLSSIEFIVDSAKFKQGRFSPVMLTPIVSPETLESSEVDTVLVMVPGIYPREVLGQMAAFKRSRSFKTYVLEDNQLRHYVDGQPVDD